MRVDSESAWGDEGGPGSRAASSASRRSLEARCYRLVHSMARMIEVRLLELEVSEVSLMAYVGSEEDAKALCAAAGSSLRLRWSAVRSSRRPGMPYYASLAV